MMNKKYFWLDTETSGRSPKAGNQILSLAIVMENSLGEKVKELDLKLKLKPEAVVEPKALSINGIDPYSPDWNSQAVTYEDAKNLVLNFIMSEASSDSELIALAYQASFDFDFFSKSFI